MLDAVQQLDSSLAFLLLAVPLAVMLGEVGFFDAAAERVASGRHLVRSLWILAALVTTVLNLDAAIVLLTPLYIRIARRNGLDPVRLAFQPVLLASLSSSALPVSNLTNLIVAEQIDASTLEFMWRLGPASLLATTVGWWAYKRLPGAAVEADLVGDADLLPIDEVDSRRAFLIGIPAVVVLLVGFVAGDLFGVEPWMVAGVVAVGLMVVTRSVPWRAVPYKAALIVIALALLANAISERLGLERLLGGGGASVYLVGLVGADVVNNLPALLVAMPYVNEPELWGLLAGVNFGPVFWISGSLAGLLWLDIVRREGLAIGWLDYARIGARVGIPAVLAATPWILLVAIR